MDVVHLHQQYNMKNKITKSTKANVSKLIKIRESKNVTQLKFLCLSPKNEVHVLPPKKKELENKKTLVLDLDESIVHASLVPVDYKDSFSVSVEDDSQKYVFYILKRPYLTEFLKFACKNFEVIIFTASAEKYANAVLDVLERDLDIQFDGRLFRDSCISVSDKHYIKDLSILGRDLDSTFIIDNTPIAYSLYPQNAIPIKSWFDDENDDELLKIMDCLSFIASAQTRDEIFIFLENFRKNLVQ